MISFLKSCAVKILSFITFGVLIRVAKTVIKRAHPDPIEIDLDKDGDVDIVVDIVTEESQKGGE